MTHVTTTNYKTLTIVHNLQIATAQTNSSHSIISSLVVAWYRLLPMEIPLLTPDHQLWMLTHDWLSTCDSRLTFFSGKLLLAFASIWHSIAINYCWLSPLHSFLVSVPVGTHDQIFVPSKTVYEFENEASFSMRGGGWSFWVGAIFVIVIWLTSHPQLIQKH
jgi:hypothetical protein